jgi:arylsulfatase A-like enzyme
VWLALAAALAGGAVELLGVAVRKFGEDRFLFLGHHVAWMVPVGLTAFVLAVAGLTWLAGGRWRRLRRPGAYVGVVVAAGMLSPLLAFGPRLHPAAAALLAIGIGVQGGRWATRRAATAVRVAPRAATGLAVALLAVAVVAAVVERRDRLADGGGAPADASLPNVLLVVLDTVRAVDLSLYGFERPTTPFLEQLGRRGVVFEQAISVTSWTLPTHATLFTGRWPNNLAADWQSPLEAEQKTLAEYFRTRGYRTGGFVGNLTYTSREVGLAQGFETYDDQVLQPTELLRSVAIGRFVYQAPRLRAAFGDWLPVRRNTAAQLRRRFLRWVDRGPADQPFLGFINLFDAHEPYDPDPSFHGRFGPVSRLSLKARIRRLVAGRGPGAYRDSSFIAESRLRYDEAIATIDHELAEVVDGLAERGRLDRTVIVVVSDHGELFGEGGQIGHGADLHINTLRVPLLIAGPGVATGVRIANPVSVRDVAKTIVDLALGNADDFRGYSLRNLWESGGGARTSLPMAMISGVIDPTPGRARDRLSPIRRGSVAALLVDSLQLVINTDGSTELNRISHEAPWARPIALAALPSDSLGGLIDTLWTRWRGRSSSVGPLFIGDVTLSMTPFGGHHVARATVIPAIPIRAVRP